jgi:hypothetical protein
MDLEDLPPEDGGLDGGVDGGVDGGATPEKAAKAADAKKTTKKKK